MIEVRPIANEGNAWELSDNESFKRPISLLAAVENGKYVLGGVDEKRLSELAELTGLDLSLRYNSQEPHPFFDSAQGRVKLENNTMFFDLSDPLNEIKVAILKGHPKIANSQEEFEEGMWPEAEFVIYDSKVEVAEQATKVAQKMKAYTVAGKMDVESKQSLIAIITGEDVRKQGTAYVDGRIGEIIEKDIAAFLKYSEQQKEDIILLALITNARALDIIVEKEGRLRFGDIALGTDNYEVLEFFKKLPNRDIRLRIQEKVDQL